MAGNTTQTPGYIWWPLDATTMVAASTAHPFPVSVVSGGGTGGTSSTFGAPFPTIGTAAGAIDASGNMAGLNLDGSGNLKIAGSITASNPSVSTTSSPVPSSGTYVAAKDGSGNLTGLSLDGSGNLKVSGTFSSSFTEPTLNVTGSASSAAVFSNFPVTSTVGYRTAAVQVTAYAAASTIVCEESNDGTTWSGIKTPNDLVTETATPITALGLYFFPVSGLQFRVRQSVYGGSGTSSVNVELRQETVALAQQSVSLTTNAQLTTINTTLGTPFQAGGSIGNTTFASTQSGTWTVALSAGSAVIGHVILDSGSTTAVTQATAASLNATVVGTGTFAVQAAQSGSWTVAATQSGTWNIGTLTSITNALPAGANILGKVGIDQTTPGTTNGVQVNAALPAGSNVIGHVITDATSTTAVTQATASSLNAQVNGPTASGASLTVNPLTQGGRAATANPTAVTDGQVVNTMHDKLGKLVAVGAIRTLKGVQDTTITASTAETTIITAVTSVFLDLYGLILANSSATATTVTIKDATAGTTRAVIYVPAGDTRGFTLPVDSAIPQAAVTNNWTATSSASITSLFVTALYVQNT